FYSLRFYQFSGFRVIRVANVIFQENILLICRFPARQRALLVTPGT
ncbi:hypothetical protein ECO9389_22851, partial [Escherichia coli O157:H- str. 493-89]